MGIDTAAGSKLFIGPVAASTVDTTGEFAALSYTAVGEIESLGEFGDQAQAITFTSLGDRRVRKFKGSYDAGILNVTVALDPADAGQAALKTALASDADYAIKVMLSDGSAGSPSQPTTFYFRAKVMSRSINVGSADNIVRASIGLGINSEIYEVAAV